jgi:Dolichyl-phosphate-mannose-protein mannosyltransferase
MVVLLATSSRYGFHRDEMYFIVAGSHPAFGYPDQPPLVPLLCWAMHALAPGSLLLLRLPSAVAAAATVVLTALIARDVGGGRRAQIIAAASTATAGFPLAVGHFVTTTTFDLLSTTAFCWLLIRAIVQRRERALLGAGIVAGVGFEAKPQIALVAVVAVVLLAVVGPRWPLRSRWFAAGAAVAVVIALPYVVWQATHGWPQLTVAGNIGGSAEGGRLGFIPFQLLLFGPTIVPIWIVGLLAPFRRPVGSPIRLLRFVPYLYATLGVLYLLGNGKAYYLASLYPALLALGAQPVAEWTTRSADRKRVLAVALAVTAIVSAVIGLPTLPARDLQGSFVMAINPDMGETVGWPQFVSTVARAWRSIPADERAHTVIFTSNYGEAGAVDVLGGRDGLPHAYSGHNAFTEWGPPGPAATSVVFLGYDGFPGLERYFTGCRTLATIDNGVGLQNQEQGSPVLLCHPAAGWPVLWPQLRHYN